MRVIEKTVAVLILAMSVWAILMMVIPRFQGTEYNRILRVELGSDVLALNQATNADGQGDNDGIDHNINMVVRNTHMDYFFILLYWLTFLSLAMLAGRMGKRFLAVCSALCISFAAVADVFENGAILTAMKVRPFTDAVAVDISEVSQWKWTFFFLASVLLGLAIALNHHISEMRRFSGYVFIACGVAGLLGIARYRVSFEFTIWMINLALLLFTVALMLTLWKVFLSLRELNHLEQVEHEHMHA